MYSARRGGAPRETSYSSQFPLEAPLRLERASERGEADDDFAPGASSLDAALGDADPVDHPADPCCGLWVATVRYAAGRSGGGYVDLSCCFPPACPVYTWHHPVDSQCKSVRLPGTSKRTSRRAGCGGRRRSSFVFRPQRRPHRRLLLLLVVPRECPCKAAQPRSSEKNAASRAGQTPCARWAVGIY